MPGFMAGDGTLGLMSRHLRGLGYRTYRSMMHANVGCTQEASEALERRIEAIALKRGRKVTIVGHSLGGLMARGLAGRRPDLVDGIVTLGSPILAPGAAHPLLLLDLKVLTGLQRAGIGKVMGEDCTSGECARLSWEQAQVRLRREVSFTSVYSRRDGIIDWRSCLDPQAKPVEVTHQPPRHGVRPDSPRHRHRRTGRQPRPSRAAAHPAGQVGGSSRRVGGLAPRREHVTAAAEIAPRTSSSTRESSRASVPSPAVTTPHSHSSASIAAMNESPAPTVSTTSVGARRRAAWRRR